jgi:hypothetical protein
VLRYLQDWDNLELQEGVLFWSSHYRDQKYKQLVLPEGLRDEVSRALHDDLGHQDRDRTISLIKQRFFWIGMDTYIGDKFRACSRCIARKSKPYICSSTC